LHEEIRIITAGRPEGLMSKKAGMVVPAFFAAAAGRFPPIALTILLAAKRA
jgi:hypothetical protein